MNKVHLVIPMSGEGSRFKAAGCAQPKPMVPVSGVPMIERVLKQFPLDWPAFFVLNEHHRNSGLVELLGQLRPGCEIQLIPPHRLGPTFAAEAVIKKLDPGVPVFVSYCDYGMVWDARQFERFVSHSQCDACVVSYRGFHAHYLRSHRFAFSRLNGERVVEVREKGSFTDDFEKEYASAGGYYFRTAQIFLDAYWEQCSQNLSLSGEFYTSLTIEALLRHTPDRLVRVFEIPKFFQWGTPEDVADFEYWERAYAAYNVASCVGQVEQLLMPMAGRGSRFQEFNCPKPLIPVHGRPMFLSALNSLPRANRTVFVALPGVAQGVSRCVPNSQIVTLQNTPAGQAFSTEKGLDCLNPADEVMVSSCDHAIVMSERVWDEFRSQRCDAAIFTIRGYPGAARQPRAFAYVDTENNSDVGAVTRVAIKQPISNRPQSDRLLVGTFWFRSAELLKLGLEAVKRKNPTVNEELYLDSVFDCLMDLRFSVKNVPLEGYLCWGDPHAYAEALYWYEVFCACNPRGPRPGNSTDRRLQHEHA